MGDQLFWVNNDQMLGLNGIANGTDITQRIGRKAIMRHIIIRFRVFNSINTDQNFFPMYRISLIYDRQCNGSSPTTADVFDLTGNPNAILGCLNLNNRERFTMLRDEIKLVDAKFVNSNASHYDLFEWKMYCNLETVFKGTSSAISDIATGGLFLCCISSMSNTFKSQLNFLQWRIRFTD